MAREQYEVHWKDYYEVLQVHPRAEQPVITAAFRKLAQLYHPDRNKKPDANGRFTEINEAYEVLSNPDRRDRYHDVYRTRHDGEEFQSEAHRDGTAGRDWDTEQRPTEPSSHESGSQRVEYDYQRNPESGSPSQGFFADLANAISPSPDESQCILPWPSWTWQRLSLIGAVPLGLLVSLISISGAAWGVLVFALLLLSGSIYAGVATGWLRRSREAPAPALIVGGACVLVSGTTYAAAAVAAVLYMRFMILGLKIAGGMLRDWWEREMK